MRLMMNGWDMDMYITTFDWLALAAGWDLDSKGTIVCFWEGLSKGIHSKAFDQDKTPHTIIEWKAATQTEVARAKEKYHTGLTGAQHHNQQWPCDSGNYQNQPHTNQLNQNAGVVPMEVNTANAQTNFKKLTLEEQAQLAKEGRCFCCHLQGHMACDCLKNTNWNFSSNALEPPQKTEPLTTHPIPLPLLLPPNPQSSPKHSRFGP